MSYAIIIKIISLVVMFIVLLILLARRILHKRDSHENEITNQHTNSPEEIDNQGVSDAMSRQGSVDYKAIRNEVYYVEYKLIPHFVDMLKEQPEKSSQIILTIHENLITLQNNLRKVNPLAFGNASSEICGDLEHESLVVYEFPKPFDMPLAKYGAIYINKSSQEYLYWTLERSINGEYVLGSMSLNGHANHGHRKDMSKDEFIHDVCQRMSVDATKLQPKNKICRRDVLELDLPNFKETLARYPFLVVCFYDYNRPSQMLIPVLEQLAQEYKDKIVVGIYDVYGGVNNVHLLEEYSLTVVPTILFLVKGKLVNKHIGLCSIDSLKIIVEESFK